MTPRPIADRYHVSPQILPEDGETLREAGFDMVICNRPCEEVPQDIAASEMRKAVEAAGLRFEVLPITHATLSPQLAAQQRELVTAAQGPVLAYCASGTRSTIAWALGEAQAGTRSCDDIIAAAAGGGYDIAGLRPTLDALIAGRTAGA